MSGANAQAFIANLDSAFDNDPVSFAAFRVNVPTGAFTWTVAGDVLTIAPAIGLSSTFALSANTLTSLTEVITAAGFVVSDFATDDDQGDLSATILMDGTGSANDPLMAYSSLVWAIGEALWVELDAAGDASDAALLCAVMATATGVWLDLWGSYFGITRTNGEADADYARRIVVEVIRPRSNNYAIAAALQEVFQQDVEVPDADEQGPASPAHDGLISFDGTHFHNATANPLYGLFDVAIGYDLLNGADPITYLTIVQTVVEQLRSAGTYLRNLTLSGGTIRSC